MLIECYNNNIKQCAYCKKHYSELDFGVAKTTPQKVYRRNKCRYCYRKTKNKLRDKRKEWLNQYKADKNCKICGISDPRVLDFHHTGDKEFGIADFNYRQFNLAKVEAEIKKCIVVCANCHRIIHSEERLKNKNGV